MTNNKYFYAAKKAGLSTYQAGSRLRTRLAKAKSRKGGVDHAELNDRVSAWFEGNESTSIDGSMKRGVGEAQTRKKSWGTGNCSLSEDHTRDVK